MTTQANSGRLKINLVLNVENRSWIIEKIADKLSERLTARGDEVMITASPEGHADIVHHMSWAFARHKVLPPSTMLITHLDDIYKMNEVTDTLRRFVDVGVCMSRDMMAQLVSHGASSEKVTYVNPAHDGLIDGRRIIIGITTRLYPDGRKRENVLLQVAKRMSLSGFEFQIFGDGWERVIPHLERSGARVEYYPDSGDFRKDYERILGRLVSFDYYLYLGMDEGSLGTLDALRAGVPTIVTPQGFHLDAAGGITHPVITAQHLEETLTAIESGRRDRQTSVATWTWDKYAEDHRRLWLATLQGRRLPREGTTSDKPTAVAAFQQQALIANAFSFRRMLSALSHTDGLAHLRRQLRSRKSSRP